MTAIREHKDASEAEREIGLCNAGAMAFRVPDLVGLLSRIGNANAKGEYYLTDAVALAAARRAGRRPVVCAPRRRPGASTRASSSRPPRPVFQAQGPRVRPWRAGPR